MSWDRVEATYAYFMGDSRVNGAMMSALQALAYSANWKAGERCFPGEDCIASLTHDSLPTVKRALRRLRELGIISSTRRGPSESNTYKFLYPIVKMKSREERYAGLTETPTVSLAPGGASSAPKSSSAPILPSDQIDPSDGSFCTHERNQIDPSEGSKRSTNKEVTLNLNKESKSEGESTSMVNVADLTKSLSASFSVTPREKPKSGAPPVSPPEDIEYLPYQLALQVCGVSDLENKKTFSNVILWRDEQSCLEIIRTFRSEIQNGEHEKLRNKAAELTKRLLALPKTKSPS